MSDQTPTQHNPTTKKPPKWVKAFLSSLELTGVVTRACEAAKIDRSTAYDLRNSDDAFAAEWAAALDNAADTLESEARRRAVDGVDEPVYQQGREVGKIRKYSDTLLIFLLKGARPEKFRDRFDHNIHGPNNGAVQVQVFSSELEKVYGDDDSSPPTG